MNHALHELHTDVATRALVRALADDPGAALMAVVARLFVVVLLGRDAGVGGGARRASCGGYSRPRTTPIEALDGDVRRRLADRRAAWEASALSPIAWVASLADEEKMALLAEVVALSLDLREERTTSLRRRARAEAVEIAALCQADVTLYWTPDAAFLAAHPKAKLLGMLDEMGVAETRAARRRRTNSSPWSPSGLRSAAGRPRTSPGPPRRPQEPDGDAGAAGGDHAAAA